MVPTKAGMLGGLAVLVLVASHEHGHAGETWRGKVVGVTDGDTITVLRGKKKVRVELHAIDCPELDQPFGKQARRYTLKVLRREVLVEVVSRDRRGIIGRVEVEEPSGKMPPHVTSMGDGKWSLNRQLVSAGLAWDRSKWRRQTEALVRQQARGLFGSETAIPPWRWRRGVREAISPLQSKFPCKRDADCVFLPKPCYPSCPEDTWRRVGNRAALRLMEREVQQVDICRPRFCSIGANLGTRAGCIDGRCRALHNVAARNACGPVLRGDVKRKIYHSIHCRHYRCKGCTATFSCPKQAARAGYRAHTDCVPEAALAGLPNTGKPDLWKQKPGQEAISVLENARFGAALGLIPNQRDEAGKKLPRRFSGGTGKWRPAAPCCQQKGGICQPTPQSKQAPDAFFSINWPHSFQYRFISRGTGRRSRFVAEARGDPECNGRVVRYRLTGSVDGKLKPRFKGPSKTSKTSKTK
jgi:endonuclease YncB( thermonuclease family)